ncbi:hypothetical protein HOLleu_16873 [Holothuria leucospilota]|uniref:Uncharacterized protein n=1 Tax=Holothuria leucospilota TaxID=206669 RepID=A0A9Q1HAR4_HOLLE|nr:hypothetical protein HOLleu_16873 [Holothuria leucospilota]
MEQGFIANDIDDPAKKKAILLPSLGPETYKLIKTLIAPPEKPSTKTFTEPVKHVQARSPMPSTERNCAEVKVQQQETAAKGISLSICC